MIRAVGIRVHGFQGEENLRQIHEIGVQTGLEKVLYHRTLVAEDQGISEYVFLRELRDMKERLLFLTTNLHGGNMGRLGMSRDGRPMGRLSVSFEV